MKEVHFIVSRDAVGGMHPELRTTIKFSYAPTEKYTYREVHIDHVSLTESLDYLMYKIKEYEPKSISFESGGFTTAMEEKFFEALKCNVKYKCTEKVTRYATRNN